MLRRAPLLALAIALLSGAVALADPTGFTVVVAAAAWLAAIGLWVTRAAGSGARLSVTKGLLQVTTDDSRFLFDLTNPALVIEVAGEPGDRRWHVSFGRRHLTPFVVDASMVEPHEFLQVLSHYRPDPAGTP